MQGSQARAGLRLLVVERDTQRVVQLPERGEVLIGRAATCAVRLEDAQASREHALLRITSVITLTDLGSTAGTFVGPRRLSANETIALSAGVPVTIGTTMIVVKHSSASVRLRHVRGHDFFERRVEEECARAAALATTFAVGRIRCDAESAPIVEDLLFERLRAVDVVALFAANEYEILLLDMSRTAADGWCEALVDLVRQRGARVEVSIASYPGDGRAADRLIATAERALESDASRGDPMSSLDAFVQRVAPSEISVLLLGETGAGKEVLATRIHALSPRASRPMLSINCAALPETLLESELFGHERGAFTGAVQSKAGLLETAEAGTLFLDEMGDMPLSIQAKLLRVIEQREVVRLGAHRARPIDVRLLSATNVDLQAAAARGAFRSDLYFRIAAVTLTVPPLRARSSEISPLATEFVEQFASRSGRLPPYISYEAREQLKTYSWPGNIRELRNMMERAVLLCTGRVITPAHLPFEMSAATPLDREPPTIASGTPTLPPPPVLPRSDDDGSEERARIVRALEVCGGNQTKAAELLNISRRTLTSRLNHYALPRPRKLV